MKEDVEFQTFTTTELAATSRKHDGQCEEGLDTMN